MSIRGWLAGWRGLNRQEVAEDLGVSRRAPGLWGARIARALRTGAERGREFVSHTPGHARKAGQLIAAKVIGVQRTARLPEHLVERSARSVLGPRKGAEPTGDWLEGYRQVAEARIPALAWAARQQAEADEGPGWSDGPDGLRPSWPDNPSRDDPDREAG